MEPQTSALEPHWRDLDGWTTRNVAPAKQFDLWRDFVVDAHLHWTIRRIRCEQFPAFIRQGRFNGFRTIHLTAAQAGIVGTRSPREISQDTEALYNLIYIAEGTQRLVMEDKEVRLPAGTFALWDSTRPMIFTTGEGLRQVTFSVPKERLLQILPRANEFTGHRMEASSGISRLFIDHMLSLDTTFGELSKNDAGAVLDATTEMLAATLSANVQLLSRRGSFLLLRQIMADINRHLRDPGLTTERIARELNISERHLYRLFEDVDTTPGCWIRRRRLERCQRDLCSPGSAHLTITAIANRWGFCDSSTFSKVFKREFGLPPRELRPKPFRRRSSTAS